MVCAGHPGPGMSSIPGNLLSTMLDPEYMQINMAWYMFLSNLRLSLEAQR